MTAARSTFLPPGASQQDVYWADLFLRGWYYNIGSVYVLKKGGGRNRKKQSCLCSLNSHKAEKVPVPQKADWAAGWETGKCTRGG